MLNHCLNRRPSAHGQYHPLKLGDIESYILLAEAYCLWDVVQSKKFSGVKTTIRYAKKTVVFHLQNLAKRFHCSEEELLKHVKESNFRESYYKIASSQRGIKTCSL